MINKILVYIYENIPARYRNYIGSRNILKPFRNSLLRPNAHYRETKVRVIRTYLDFQVDFYFYASIKVAAKARRFGIENTLLRHSLKLISNKDSKNNMLILDVGANFGFLSMVWANTICKNGTVHAFEPNIQVHDSFKKSINENTLNEKVYLNNFAVGRENGIVNLYTSSTSSNIINSSKQDGLPSSIRMVSLDSYIEENGITKCDLVKIDVDGIEYEILKGARSLIERFKPVFIVESNGDKRIIEFFKTKNYQVLDMELNSYKDEDSIPSNILCFYEDELITGKG